MTNWKPIEKAEPDERKHRIEILQKRWLNHCTCENCSEKYDCQHAYDFYNTNGDCLAEK